MKKKNKKADDKKDKWMEEAQTQINLELKLKKLIKEYNKECNENFCAIIIPDPETTGEQFCVRPARPGDFVTFTGLGWHHFIRKIKSTDFSN
jgi:hypothetical protein